MNHKRKLTYVVKDNSCWEPIGRTILNGYPIIWSNGRNEYVHRFVYSELFGEIPKGMVVRHKCDNTLCMNPEHLEIGTYAENSNDMISRGRSLQGIKTTWAKLTENQVKEVLSSTLSQRKLAKIYNVSHVAIYLVRKRKTYKNVSL